MEYGKNGLKRQHATLHVGAVRKLIRESVYNHGMEEKLVKVMHQRLTVVENKNALVS